MGAGAMDSQAISLIVILTAIGGYGLYWFWRTFKLFRRPVKVENSWLMKLLAWVVKPPQYISPEEIEELRSSYGEIAPRSAAYIIEASGSRQVSDHWFPSDVVRASARAANIQRELNNFVIQSAESVRIQHELTNAQIRAAMMAPVPNIIEVTKGQLEDIVIDFAKPHEYTPDPIRFIRVDRKEKADGSNT